MKVLTIVLSVLAIMLSAQAAVLKVAADGTQAFTDIQSAIDAASPSDSIVVQGGAYTGFNVDKRLVIIGSGTGTGIGEGVFINGFCTISAGSDSTELRSLWILDNPFGSTDSLASVLVIHSGLQNIFIWRCYLENNTTASNSGLVFQGYETSVEYSQCVFAHTGELTTVGHYGIYHRDNVSIVLTNCLFSGAQYIVDYGLVTDDGTITAKHCTFVSTGTTLYAAFSNIAGIYENCSFYSGTGTTYYNNNAPNLTYSYCAGTALPPGVGAVLTTIASVDSLNYDDPRFSDYHPSVGSNLIDAGNPGSPFDLDGSAADIGIYGGQHPYVEDGVPDYPFAVQVEVPYSAPLDGTMRIWGRGRVGPGN